MPIVEFRTHDEESEFMLKERILEKVRALLDEELPHIDTVNNEYLGEVVVYLRKLPK